MLEWLLSNKIEVLGAILGITYIFFSIRQNILTWPTGLLTSALYTIVFFQSKFYADMGLQIYYVVISIYGWYFWLKGAKPENGKTVPVRNLTKKLSYKLVIVTVVIYFVLLTILLEFTDSDVPFMDSFTTALSIVATWMLAKKYIEHWLIWIFVDLFSSGLYIYKNLWPTVILFLVYTTMAYFGFKEWNKNLKQQTIE
ncbi:MAG: nicotinamide mononucleotide transporter [Prolixibacteraceae bacterium]|nr:nicotinamide mononucleotide transporter [Prolixibacteraceae bacterium]MBT6765695.1 nicotinamide mononucleotide transporter [Prolixibacteraceae bacterium]MBT6999303.1 nicotinamide mononucleotide transporter [Prolixibacteraceae bacterium]MBT7393199.1 nicotinamide mononucleotide transporter [Prolixibacteraceae bacterium]